MATTERPTRSAACTMAVRRDSSICGRGSAGEAVDPNASLGGGGEAARPASPITRPTATAAPASAAAAAGQTLETNAAPGRWNPDRGVERVGEAPLMRLPGPRGT